VVPDLPDKSFGAGNAVVDETKSELLIFGGSRFDTAPKIKVSPMDEVAWG